MSSQQVSWTSSRLVLCFEIVTTLAKWSSRLVLHQAFESQLHATRTDATCIMQVESAYILSLFPVWAYIIIFVFSFVTHTFIPLHHGFRFIGALNCSEATATICEKTRLQQHKVDTRYEAWAKELGNTASAGYWLHGVVRRQSSGYRLRRGMTLATQRPTMQRRA